MAKRNICVMVVAVVIIIVIASIVSCMKPPVETEEQAIDIAEKFAQKVYFWKELGEYDLVTYEEEDFWIVSYTYITDGYTDLGGGPEIYVSKSNGSTIKTFVTLIIDMFE